MAQRGLFITFEGGEGAGKTTQIRKLADALGPDVVVTREPGGTPQAEAIRDMFFAQGGQNWPPDALVLLMFAARVLHTENLIRPALESGKSVLCDRYTDSTRVYQGHAGNLSIDKINAVKELAIGDFEPDLTFILDLPPEQGLSRAHARKGETSFEARDITFHEKIRAGFLAVARDNPHRCIVIDAGQDAETVAEQILQSVKSRVR